MSLYCFIDISTNSNSKQFNKLFFGSNKYNDKYKQYNNINDTHTYIYIYT